MVYCNIVPVQYHNVIMSMMHSIYTYKDACIVNILKFNIIMFSNFRLMKPNLSPGQREQGMLSSCPIFIFCRSK